MLWLYRGRTKQEVSIGEKLEGVFWGGYGLCDVVDYDCAVCVAVVHWGEGFIAFLACCVPYLEFDCCTFIKGNRLCKKCRSNLQH